MQYALAVFALATLGTGLSDVSPATQPAGTVVDARNVLAVQRETDDPGTGRYDWAPSVVYDGELYRMWFVRLGGSNAKRFPYAGLLPDGERFEFTYPDYGDRIYYAESRDGTTWHLDGEDFSGPPEAYGPDSPGPLLVIGPAESAHERMHVGCPSVIRVDGTWYLYYETSCEFKLHRDANGKPAVGNEYHAQVFVATSENGRTWRKHPDNRSPLPIIAAPEANKRPGRQRYGLGQPSVFYRDGRFVLHYVDSCNGPGDFIVRVEADNPRFKNARVFREDLAPGPQIPSGAVARFAQTDVKYLGDVFYLVRPAYGTGNLNLLASRSGVFNADANAQHPKDVFPQVRISDPRDPTWRERLFPRFLTDPEGRILIRDHRATLFYSSGAGFKDKAYTWDIHRCEVELPRKVTGYRE
ncbi:MAG: hypothetical protein AMXMBFR13_04290 [Phycisphaerae bacterium]